MQRITDPATPLPPLGDIGKVYEKDEDAALDLCFIHAKLMASEMLALGVDMSYAPTLDLNRDSRVVGDRAFHYNPIIVRELGRAYIKGMRDAGMASCAKHFPGHGSVVADTHAEGAVDRRLFEEIAIADLRPFSVAVQQRVDAIMVAHVTYPEVDPEPAGFSEKWVSDILRQRVGFQGVVISDDLGMQAAHEVGTLDKRLHECLDAGCDFMLVCAHEDVALIEDALTALPRPTDDRRLFLRRRRVLEWESYAHSRERAELIERLKDGFAQFDL